MVAQYVQHERSIRVSVRGGAPGTGKSRKLFQDWENKNDSRKLYLSHSHSFLSEQSLRVKGRVRHLYGLRRICPCLRDDDYGNVVIMKLVDLKFSTKYICSICKQIKAYPTKDCHYQQQLKHIKDFPVVVAPVEFVFTQVLDMYQPQIIAVDDCLTRISPNPLRNDLEYMLIHFSDLAGQPLTSEHPIQELISRSNYHSFMMKLKKVWTNRVKRLAEEVRNSTKPSSYDKIFVIHPEEINTYVKQAQVHGFRDRFATPALFPLFDYLFKNKTEDDEVQLKIIEAIPKMEFLNSLATRYQAEENVTVIFEHDGFEPKLVDRGSVVHRYIGKKGAWYPTTSSIKESFDTRENIRKVITKILEKEYNNDYDLQVRVITPKSVAGEYFVPRRFSAVETLNFGNLRGKNSLENCDVLFVIGTYCINKVNMEQEFSNWYACDPLTMEFVEKKPHGDYYHYKDKAVEILRWMKEDYEMYQAIHRIRPLLKKKQAYVFGLVPKEISLDGLKVIKIKGGWEKTLNKKEWLENYMEIHRKELAIFVEEKFAVKFFISEKWAYREVKKIVKNSEHLEFEQDRGRWVVYVE